MAKRASWFGVRTLYRATPTGRALGTDRFYSRDVTLVEERVVIFKAASAKTAIQAAEREAKRYASSSHRNPYGQRVRMRYLGYLDAYLMFEQPDDAVEVFSETELVSRSVSDRTISARPIGRPESVRSRALRRNILNIVFNAPASGVEPTRQERAFRSRFTRRLKR